MREILDGAAPEVLRAVFRVGKEGLAGGVGESFFEDHSLCETRGTTMNFLDIIIPVIMLGIAYLLLFTCARSGWKG